MYCFSQTFYPCVLLPNGYKKELENRIFSECVDRKKAKQKQNKTKKIQAQVFRYCYVQNMSEISGKYSEPYSIANSN